jgi:Protein of unknown function (DUF2905)
VLVVIGLAVSYAPWLVNCFGRLPGYIRIQNEKSFVFIPIVSMLVVSIVMSLIISLFFREYGRCVGTIFPKQLQWKIKPLYIVPTRFVVTILQYKLVIRTVSRCPAKEFTIFTYYRPISGLVCSTSLFPRFCYFFGGWKIV